MPRLEEVLYYIQGLWLLLKGKPEAYSYLDMSERGFRRSFWSLLYCLPPTLLGYVAQRALLSTLDGVPKVDGGGYYLKAAMIDYGSILVSIMIFFGVARLGGFGRYAMPIIIALNWLNVPLQWGFSIGSLGQILAPGNTDLIASTLLLQLLVVNFVSYQIISRIVGGHALTAIATFLTLNIVPILAQSKLASLL